MVGQSRIYMTEISRELRSLLPAKPLPFPIFLTEKDTQETNQHERHSETPTNNIHNQTTQY